MYNQKTNYSSDNSENNNGNNNNYSDNNNSCNNNLNDNFNNSNNNNNSCEIVFWKVFNNIYLFKKILFHIEDDIYLNNNNHDIQKVQKIKFKYLNTLKFLTNNSLWSIIKCKSLANEYIHMDNESIYNFLNQCRNKETIRIWYYSNFEEFKLKDLLKQCLSSNNIVSFETLMECGAPIYKSTIEQAISYGNISVVKRLLELNPVLLEKIKPFSFANSQDMVYYLLSLKLPNGQEIQIPENQNEKIRFEIFYQFDSFKLKYKLVSEGYVETPSNQLFLEIIKYESLEEMILNLTIIDRLLQTNFSSSSSTSSPSSSSTSSPSSSTFFSLTTTLDENNNDDDKYYTIETLLLIKCQKMLISNPSIINLNIENILLNYLKKFKKFNNILLPQIIYYYTFSTLCLDGLNHLVQLRFKGNNCINNTGHDFVSGVLNSFNNNIFEYYLVYSLSQQQQQQQQNNNINNINNQQIQQNENNNNIDVQQPLQQFNFNEINPNFLLSEYKKNCKLIKIDKSIFKDSKRVILFINHYYNQDIEKLIVFRQRINLVKKIFYNCSVDILEKIQDNKYFTTHFTKVCNISSLKELEFEKYKWLIKVIERDYIGVFESSTTTITEAQFLFNVKIQDDEYSKVVEFIKQLWVNHIYRNSNFFRIIAAPLFSSIKSINSSTLFGEMLREFELLKYPQQLINEYYNRMYRALLSHAVSNFDLALLEYIEIKVGVVGMNNNLTLLPISPRECVKSSNRLTQEQKSVYISFVNHINSKSNYYRSLMGSILYSLYYPQFNLKYFNFQKYLSSTLTFIRFLAKRLDFSTINVVVGQLFKGLQLVDGIPFQIELFTEDCFHQPKLFINNQFNQIKTSPVEIIKFLEIYNIFCPSSYKTQLYPTLYSILLSCKDINIQLVEKFQKEFFIKNGIEIPHDNVSYVFKYIHLKSPLYIRYFLTNHNILPFIDSIEFSVNQFNMERLTFTNIIYGIQSFEDMVFLLKNGMFKSNANLYSNIHCNRFLIQLNREDVIINHPDQFKITEKDALHEQFEIESLKLLLKSKSPIVIQQLKDILLLSNQQIIQLSIKMNRVDVIHHLYANQDLEHYIKKSLITYIVKFNLIHSLSLFNLKLLELNDISYKDILNDGHWSLFKFYISFLKSNYSNNNNLNSSNNIKHLLSEIQCYINNNEKLKDFNLIINQ